MSASERNSGRVQSDTSSRVRDKTLSTAWRPEIQNRGRNWARQEYTTLRQVEREERNIPWVAVEIEIPLLNLIITLRSISIYVEQCL